MLRFSFYPPKEVRFPPDLQGAHVVGSESVPLRAEIMLTKSEIRCDIRSQAPAGLSLLWPVKGVGVLQLETTRLLPREEPYHLNIELARHRLMRINFKREEWGLFDYSGMEQIAAQVDQARELFIQALEQKEEPARAAELADQSLSLSVAASEQMARFHASVFLARRQQAGGFARQFLGAAAPIGGLKPALLKRVQEFCDFVRVPFVWRDLQPKESPANYEALGETVKAVNAAKLALRGGPLLNFGVRAVPDWMYIYENDFDQILEYARDHVKRAVQKFGGQIHNWIVASGLHADSVFTLNFEQIIELTRMAATVTKQAAPRAQVVIDITQPFGEYHARNQRTVPPLLYADMLVQSGIPFDAFGLQFLCGIGSEGYHVRDLLQISALIDRLANLGKPIHLTALGAPAQGVPGAGGLTDGGEWHGPWSEATQADWLAALAEIALSKPYVESVCVDALLDAHASGVPAGGILKDDFQPRAAFTRLAALHKRLQAGG